MQILSDKELFQQWKSHVGANTAAICAFVQRGDARRGVVLAGLRELLTTRLHDLPFDFWSAASDDLATDAATILSETYKPSTFTAGPAQHVVALLPRVSVELGSRLFSLLSLSYLGEEDSGNSAVFESGPPPMLATVLFSNVPATFKRAADAALRDLVDAELRASGTDAHISHLPVLRAYLRPIQLFPFGKNRGEDLDLFADQIRYLTGLTVRGELLGSHAWGRILDLLPENARAVFVSAMIRRGDGNDRLGNTDDSFALCERMRQMAGIPSDVVAALDEIIAARRPHVEARLAVTRARAAQTETFERQMR